MIDTESLIISLCKGLILKPRSFFQVHAPKKTNVIPETKDLDDEFNMSNLGTPPAIPRNDEFKAKFNGPFFLVLILRPKLITQTSCVAKSLVSHQWNPSKTNCNNNIPPSESLCLSPYHCLPGKGIWKDRITASNVSIGSRSKILGGKVVQTQNRTFKHHQRWFTTAFSTHCVKNT